MKKRVLVLAMMLFSFGTVNTVSSEDQLSYDKLDFDLYNIETENVKVTVMLDLKYIEEYFGYFTEYEDEYGIIHRDFSEVYSEYISWGNSVGISHIENTPFVEYYSNNLGSERMYRIFYGSVAKSPFVERIFIESNYEDDEIFDLDDGGDGGAFNWCYGNHDVIDENRYTNHTQYKGDGIKVGILETGIPDFECGEFENTNITYMDYDFDDVSEHASWVAAIMVGDKGIASDAELYSATIEGYLLSGMQDEVYWMIQNGVNVINISWGDSTDILGMYKSLDAYIDYIISYYDISIVKSAGNTNPTSHVTSPGLGYNIVTVGNLSNSSQVSGTSSYLDSTNRTDIAKPTISAIGNLNVYEFGSNTSIIKSGTSLSAPVVTGTIAAMMDKDNTLIGDPMRVIAILTVNAEKDNLEVNYDFSINGLNDRVGAGEIDVGEAINGVDYSGSYKIRGNLNNYPVGVLMSDSLTVQEGDNVRVSLWWERVCNSNYQWSMFYDFDLVISLFGQEYVQNYNSDVYNFEVLEFSSNYSEDLDLSVHLMDEIYNDHGLVLDVAYAYRIE